MQKLPLCSLENFLRHRIESALDFIWKNGARLRL